ncbi:hypothetical protein QQ008_18005 [Fulvivirgaceae bacterium BMA10]|uniref:Uncharacterized protein n=1 Tax=Splendidivirga corallicola TaxID=3051826 RepID=A0ABT8KSX0_9BACT|nr:hypothetical protein [Fulvivirgaceae bacterium BMA10]
MRTYKFLTIFGLVLLTQISLAQEVSNVNWEVKKDSVYISYDLINTSEDFVYSIKLFSIIKGYPHCLSRASGDIGRQVSGGENKKITWSNSSELSTYRLSDMQFMVKVFNKTKKEKVEVSDELSSSKRIHENYKP